MVGAGQQEFFAEWTCEGSLKSSGKRVDADGETSPLFVGNVCQYMKEWFCVRQFPYV